MKRWWNCNKWKMIVGACASDLAYHFWKMTYFDITAIVSNCEKMIIFALVLVELVFWSPNMSPLHKLKFNWLVKYPILCPSHTYWHNLGFLINLYWIKLHQNCFGGCTNYANHNPNLKCAKCFYVTQSRLCHQRATRQNLKFLVLGICFMALV